jgi:hypothetical protein
MGGAVMLGAPYNIIKNGFGMISVKQFGAVGDGVTDDTAAIQGAIDVMGALGGGGVWLPQGNYAHTGLTLCDGVRFLGAGDSYNGTGGSVGKGTVLTNTANGPAIMINGDTGYGFEIAGMHLLGNGGAAEDGIYLVKTDGRVPRSAWIHDCSIKGCGRDGLRLDGFSYVNFERINIVSCLNGTHIVDDTGAGLREFGWFTNVYVNDCTDYSVVIDLGNNLYFNNIDMNDSRIGLYIHGGAYGLFFDRLNVVRMLETGIELNADTAHVGRMAFRGLSIYMKGADAAEKAIYAHRAAAFTVFNTLWDYIDIGKAGATAPTNSISGDNGFIGASLHNVRDVSGGAIALASSNYQLDFLSLDKSGTAFKSGNGADVAFTVTLTNASQYPSAPVILCNTNQTIAYSANVSNVPGGNLDLVVTFASPPAPGANNIQIHWAIQP